MKISTRDLLAQHARFSAQYPWVHDVEAVHGLPRGLLYAVASRETNMTDEVGDGGHGHGPWQEDDRSKGREAIIARIDSGDVEYAAEVAAQLLAGLYAHYGDWTAACNAYNSGQPQTSKTTGHDYGPDVMDRCRFLADLPIPGPPPAPAPNPQPVVELDVQIANTAKTSFLPAAAAGFPGLDPQAGYDLHADGGVDAINGAPFYGGWFNLPDDARAGQPNGPFLALTPRRDRQPGYELQRFDGAFYTMGPGLNGFPA